MRCKLQHGWHSGTFAAVALMRIGRASAHFCTRPASFMSISTLLCLLLPFRFTSQLHNAELLFREDVSADDLIDVIEGNRKYVR